MRTNNILSARQGRLIRHWFTKIDANTIEIKSKWKGEITFFILIGLLSVFIYQDFIKPNALYNSVQKIELLFQPQKSFEKSFKWRASAENPNITRYGKSKEEFMKESWILYKKYNLFWDGLFFLSKYIVILLVLLLPTKKRIRLDRRRGIIYTYIGKKFYITELKKLMRPLPEYFINSGRLIFWIHPYTAKPPLIRGYFRGSQCVVSDYTMYFPVLFGGVLFNQTIFEKSGSAQLKKFLVDFMNPDLEPEKLNSMMNALESKKSIGERLLSLAFGWIDGGLYTKKLPPQKKLEAMIAKYFREEAPKIRALPSFTLFDDTDMKAWRKPTLVIVSVEENRKAGFKKVPCPNLYEYPETTMHRSENQPDVAWGNVKGREI